MDILFKTRFASFWGNIYVVQTMDAKFKRRMSTTFAALALCNTLHCQVRKINTWTMTTLILDMYISTIGDARCGGDCARDESSADRRHRSCRQLQQRTSLTSSRCSRTICCHCWWCWCCWTKFIFIGCIVECRYSAREWRNCSSMKIAFVFFDFFLDEFEKKKLDFDQCCCCARGDRSQCESLACRWVNERVVSVLVLIFAFFAVHWLMLCCHLQSMVTIHRRHHHRRTNHLYLVVDHRKL